MCKKLQNFFIVFIIFISTSSFAIFWKANHILSVSLDNAFICLCFFYHYLHNFSCPPPRQSINIKLSYPLDIPRIVGNLLAYSFLEYIYTIYSNQSFFFHSFTKMFFFKREMTKKNLKIESIW